MFRVERLAIRDNCRVVALHDDCADACRRASGFARVVTSAWRQFLECPEVELVWLATPPASRAAMAIEALAGGKHVVVEAPLALELAQADAVLAAAGRAGRSVIVAHTRRWDDDFVAASDAMARGIIGRLRAVKRVTWQYASRSGQPMAGPPAADGGSAVEKPPGGDPRDSHREKPPGRHWRDSRSSGGGTLWERGIHYFDQLLRLAGNGIESVYARLTPARDNAAVDDAFLAVVTFQDGLCAHIEVNRAAHAPLETGWMLAGDAGSYAGFTEYTPTAAGEIVDVPLERPADDVDEFVSALAGHLRSGDPNPIPAIQARAAVALVEAACRSDQERRPVTVSQAPLRDL
jgi:predicted dehydrogenase